MTYGFRKGIYEMTEDFQLYPSPLPATRPVDPEPVWTPDGDCLVMHIPDRFVYGDEEFGAGLGQPRFEFRLEPLGDGFVLTATHSTRNSHLDSIEEEFPSVSAATAEVDRIIEAWGDTLEMLEYDRKQAEKWAAREEAWADREFNGE